MPDTDPASLKNIIWSPILQYRLGETTHSNAPCIIVEYHGETGERVSIVFESADALEAAAIAHSMALECLKEANEIGYEPALAKFNEMLSEYNSATGLKTDIPDDISSLDASEENE